jgi:hypothetical protein
VRIVCREGGKDRKARSHRIKKWRTNGRRKGKSRDRERGGRDRENYLVRKGREGL